MALRCQAPHPDEDAMDVIAALLAGWKMVCYEIQ
jgi:hypothetical protein